MSRADFKILRNLSHDKEDVRLLRLLGQLMSKNNYRDFDVAIKHLFLTNREYQGHNRGARVLIDHTACEKLRDYTKDMDQIYAPYQTEKRLNQLIILINKIK